MTLLLCPGAGDAIQNPGRCILWLKTRPPLNVGFFLFLSFLFLVLGSNPGLMYARQALYHQATFQPPNMVFGLLLTKFIYSFTHLFNKITCYVPGIVLSTDNCRQ
jgi:hypothetical protein